MNLSPEKKIAGVLAPLFALRTENDLGIGDLAALREFIDWSVTGGFKLVQLLPINETGGDNSPYNAISAVAIDPTTIELAPGTPVDLTEAIFNEVVSTVDLTKLRRGPIKYRQVKKLKRDLLKAAFRAFGDSGSEERKREFHEFVEGQSGWLRDYTLFRALMEENGGSEAWDQWPEEHRTVDRARQWLSELPPDRQETIGELRIFFCYIQWIAHQQWRDIKAYAEQRGIALMGDIPFGVSYYSADVFARPNEFALDWAGGAPPEPYFKDDEFTQKWGQNWGIPLYNWQSMRGNDFQWWRQRVGGVKHAFHVFRIDHVLGFYRIYAFPWRPTLNAEFLPLNWDEMKQRTGGREPHFAPRDDSNHENAEANRREGEEYLRVVLQEAGATRVVGEDLGTVPDYVRPNLQSMGIAGFKIPQWEVRHDQVVPGAQYERVSVATYATHDHKPIRALWEEAFEVQTSTSEQAKGDLVKIAQFAGIDGDISRLDYERDFYRAIMQALFASNAWAAVVMLTDLMARKDRINVPGTAADSNWTRRSQRTVAQLRESRKERSRMRFIRGLLEKTERV
ncbi:MAG: 4-alpha-glucanotransferase [Chthoniobacterales bacterium]